MKYLSTALFLIAATFSFAQEGGLTVYSSGTYYEGYVKETDGTVHQGYIRYSNPYTIQSTVEFYTDKTDKKSKVKYNTDDLSEYKVGEKIYHCIHYSGGLLDKPVKGNLLTESGCISSYVWYDKADNYMTMTKTAGESDLDFQNRKFPPTTIYLKKGEEKVHEISYFGLKFAEKMSEYVSDNEELSNKVKNKEKGYKMLNFDAIIEEYNKSCEE